MMSEKVRGYVTNTGERGMYIPDFAVSLWRIKFRDMYGIDLDKDVARVILQTKYSESTWKWKRAIRHIEEILVNKGFNREHAMKFARQVVDLALQ